MYISRLLAPDKKMMRKHSVDQEFADMLIVTTNEAGEEKPLNSIPTIYPNDFDYDAEHFRAKSSASRSFIRPAKTLGQEHRNKSVPHSLQVPTAHFLFTLDQKESFFNQV